MNILKGPGRESGDLLVNSLFLPPQGLSRGSGSSGSIEGPGPGGETEWPRRGGAAVPPCLGPEPRAPARSPLNVSSSWTGRGVCKRVAHGLLPSAQRQQVPAREPAPQSFIPIITHILTGSQALQSASALSVTMRAAAAIDACHRRRGAPARRQACRVHPPIPGVKTLHIPLHSVCREERGSQRLRECPPKRPPFRVETEACVAPGGPVVLPVRGMGVGHSGAARISATVSRTDLGLRLPPALGLQAGLWEWLLQALC